MGEIIFLTGFMGSGKSTVARIYSQKMKMRHIDTDLWIQKKAGLSISEIFEKEGESSFRAYESEALKEIGNEKGDFVVSLGGGALLDAGNLEYVLSRGSLVYLEASEKSLAERLKKGLRKRPLLAEYEAGGGKDPQALEKKISEILSVRREIYEKAPFRILTDGMEPEQVAEELGRILSR